MAWYYGLYSNEQIIDMIIHDISINNLRGSNQYHCYVLCTFGTTQVLMVLTGTFYPSTSTSVLALHTRPTGPPIIAM